MQKRIQKQSGLPTNADRTRPETEGWYVKAIISKGQFEKEGERLNEIQI